MAYKVHRDSNQRTRCLVASKDYFYPGEVVRILGLEGLDYRQLARLYELATAHEQTRSRHPSKWRRFTFEQLVAIRTAFDLVGGQEALHSRCRLRWKAVEAVCKTLRNEYGIENPLLQVRLERVGKAVVVHHEGITFDPRTGQMILSTIDQGIAKYVKLIPKSGLKKDAAELLQGFKQVVRNNRTRRVSKRAGQFHPGNG